MADETQPAPTPEKPKRRLGWAYLVVAVLALGVFGVYVFKPELPRQLLGGVPAKPSSLGDEPAAAGEVSGKDLADRAVQAELAGMGTVTTRSPAAATAAPKPVDAAPAAAPIAATANDEPRAAELLATAEKQYAAMDWEKAESTAAKVAALDCKPATKGRGAEIAAGAPALKKLFKDLDDRDELNRNWDSHPSLVKLIQNGHESLAVPLVSMDDPPTAVVDGAEAWLAKMKQQGKKAAFMLKGAKQYSKAELDLAAIEFQPVDLAELKTKLSAQLDGRIAQLKADRDLARDPGAWYEAGKFAYRNRLDDRVTELLDHARQLDPFLFRTVREGNAALLFGAMVTHMKNGNKQQAAAFMASIEKRYKDTDQGRQARLYYDGKTAELIAATRDAERKAREEAEARKQARLAAAKAKQDVAAVKQIQQEEQDDAAAAAAADANAPPEIAKARELKDKGRALLSEATNMPPTNERNAKYHEAAKLLAQAKAAYAGYCQKNQKDDAAQVELVECQKMWFLANKSQTL